VIIGPDMVVRNGRIITDVTKRASSDQSFKGIKNKLKENPKEAKETADMIIKNTYHTLLTRGMKGCYIYSVDPETQDYFKNNLNKQTSNSTVYNNNSNGASVSFDK
jgi:DUF2075 family protein